MNADWLKQLSPAHAPPPPSWWPLAPGWWALVFIFLTIFIVWFYWTQHQSVRLRRKALRELKHLEIEARDSVQLASKMQNLLRRYAIAMYGRDKVSNLNGDDWLAFIVEHGGHALKGDAGAALLSAAYGKKSSHETALWFKGARGFFRGK